MRSEPKENTVAVPLAPKWWLWLVDHIASVPASAWALILILLVMPLVASEFFLFQVFGWAFILGIISLSLMFLAGYGGMVSLIQMSVAGLAGYMVALFGSSGADISLGLPWWFVVPLAIFIATVFGTVVGLLAVRTEGIYTIMITLAMASAFFYFTRQNYTIFNGYTGFNLVLPPELFGVDWRRPVPFYYLTLGVAAASYLLVTYVSRAPFGLALQGVRDNARRMSALGYNVTAHRVAAYAFASVLASIGGILLVWQNAQIVPGTAGIGAVFDILIIAVLGGLARPSGPFLGAFLFVLLATYAPEFLRAIGASGERYKTLIGAVFLLVVYFSPDGMLGLWERWKARISRDRFHGMRGE
jgi:branched-chain amino acid transport system permease protein